MLKELPKEGLINLMYIFNAILRLEYWPKSLKIAQTIMIPKPGKNPMDVPSFRPISLLPTILKVLVKLILKKINKDLNPQDWIPNHQFGF
jgi:potassium voltage-gated channel Eag-related subfamily H protein 8